jgi:hypothetical protein
MTPGISLPNTTWYAKAIFVCVLLRRNKEKLLVCGLRISSTKPNTTDANAQSYVLEGTSVLDLAAIEAASIIDKITQG